MTSSIGSGGMICLKVVKDSWLTMSYRWRRDKDIAPQDNRPCPFSLFRDLLRASPRHVFQGDLVLTLLDYMATESYGLCCHNPCRGGEQ